MTSDSMEYNRHELLQFVHDVALSILNDHQVDAHLAEQVSAAIPDRLADEWGGQLISFPKDYFFKIALRDQQIYKDFNGHNHAALARKYGITVRAIYNIIKRVRRRGDPNQHDLF